MKRRIEGEPKRTAALPWLTLPTMNSTEQRLFTPGSGSTPSALTGRDPEQAVLNRCLADLAGGASPPHDYQDRYRELEAGGLLPAAVALAPVFQAGADATASDQDIDAALAATGGDAAARLAVREALHRLGYVWCPPGQLPPVTWSAGIPSLMAHVLDHAKPSAPERAHP